MSGLGGLAVAGLGGKALGFVTGPARLYIELAVVGVLLAAIGTQTWRVHSWQAKEGQARAEAKSTLAAWNAQVADGVRVAFVAAEKERAEENRRTAAQRENVDETQRIAARNRSAAPAARDAHERLLDRATAAISAPGGGESRGDPAAAVGRPPTGGAGLVLVGVLGRLDLVAEQLAIGLDEARNAGLSCERAYDSLTVTGDARPGPEPLPGRDRSASSTADPPPETASPDGAVRVSAADAAPREPDGPSLRAGDRQPGGPQLAALKAEP